MLKVILGYVGILRSAWATGDTALKDRWSGRKEMGVGGESGKRIWKGRPIRGETHPHPST